MPDFMIGYGEDSLTLWAISTQLASIVPEWSDDSVGRDLLVFSRPSFGRGQNVGEFDAMLITLGCVYLIESKWHRSREYKQSHDTILLSESQLRRHESVERWLRSSKHGEAPNNQLLMPEGRTLKSSTILSNNCDHIWNTIKGHCNPLMDVVHVCLFFSPISKKLPVPSVDSSELESFKSPFRVVPLSYIVEDRLGGFIRLSKTP